MYYPSESNVASKNSATDQTILANAEYLDEIADVIRYLNGQIARLSRLRGYQSTTEERIKP
jgi:hypothetical protein